MDKTARFIRSTLGGQTDVRQGTSIFREEEGKLNLWGLVVVGFFWVCGGMYGNEPLCAAAPPGIIIAMLTAGAVGYALPMSLLTAEMAVAFPQNGGQLVPVEKAFGSPWAMYDGFLLWLVCSADSSIYPIFAAKYANSFLHMEETAALQAIGSSIIVPITAMHLLGVDWIVSLAAVFIFFSTVPTALFMLVGAQYWDTSRVFSLARPADYAWGKDGPMLAIMWIAWLFSGFSELGVMGGQIENPTSTFPSAICILIPVAWTFYAIPVSISVSIDPNPVHYKTGHFLEVSDVLTPSGWLKKLLLVGAVFSNIGLYNGVATECKEMLGYSVELQLADYLADWERKTEWGIIRFFLKRADEEGCRRIFALVQGCCALVLMHLPIQALVESTMILYLLLSTLYLAAFAFLKVYRPDVQRDLPCPGGYHGSLFIALWLGAVNLGVLFCSLFVGGWTPSKVLDVKLTVFCLCAGCWLYFAYLLISSCCETMAANRREFAQKQFRSASIDTLICSDPMQDAYKVNLLDKAGPSVELDQGSQTEPILKTTARAWQPDYGGSLTKDKAKSVTFKEARPGWRDSTFVDEGSSNVSLQPISAKKDKKTTTRFLEIPKQT